MTNNKETIYMTWKKSFPTMGSCNGKHGSSQLDGEVHGVVEEYDELAFCLSSQREKVINRQSTPPTHQMMPHMCPTPGFDRRIERSLSLPVQKNVEHNKLFFLGGEKIPHGGITLSPSLMASPNCSTGIAPSFSCSSLSPSHLNQDIKSNGSLASPALFKGSRSNLVPGQKSGPNPHPNISCSQSGSDSKKGKGNTSSGEKASYSPKVMVDGMKEGATRASIFLRHATHTRQESNLVLKDWYMQNFSMNEEMNNQPQRGRRHSRRLSSLSEQMMGVLRRLSFPRNEQKGSLQERPIIDAFPLISPYDF